MPAKPPDKGIRNFPKGDQRLRLEDVGKEDLRSQRLQH